MFQAVCFDFDYTLGDCTDSIVAGFQHGLTAMGWPAPDREAIRATIGYLLEDAYTMLTGDKNPENRAKFRPLFLEVAQELQRIAREREKAQKGLEMIERKLNNQAFVAKAPEAVVNAEREKAEKYRALIAQLDQSAAAMGR